MKKLFSLLLSAVLLLSMMAVPAGANAESSREPEPLYYDIGHLDSWTQSKLEWLDHMGLMQGTAEGTFSPDAPYTRAMFVTMLGRLDKIDPADYPGSSFSDVPAGRWDAPYIRWASETGLVNGVGNGRFDPTGIITVEQYAVIVYRYLVSHGYEFCFEEVTDPIREPVIYDFDEVSEYAEDAVALLGYTGLLLTDPETSLKEEPGIYVRPKHHLNRLETAIFFNDFAGLVYTSEVYREMPWGGINSWVEK